MKHINVALFVPFAGCKHQCSFCNQKAITGTAALLKAEDVISSIKTAMASPRYSNDAEIAFFGGSFTAIDSQYMDELLTAAFEYVKEGFFKGIRISTRPDCIDDEILIHLKKYGVIAIELGAQSMSNFVLESNQRGHTVEDTVKASKLILKYGFELGLQMMTGLYNSTDEDCIMTAKKLIELKPATIRIYPAIVLKHTPLSNLYQNGDYKPQSLENAVDLCSKLMMMFESNKIKVIRLGLHSGGDVETQYIAGPYHPSFAELCKSKIYLQKILNKLSACNIKSSNITIEINQRYLSQVIGQKKSNIEYLGKIGYKVELQCRDNLNEYEINIKYN